MPRKPNAEFMKPMHPDAVLAEVVGSGPMPRTAVVKAVWVYIKKHNLQDKKEKRMINPDAKMAAVFGSNKQISMFAMTKAVFNHLKK